jgi:hypothetical protein
MLARRRQPRAGRPLRAAQRLIVAPSTWSAGFAFWDVRSTTPVGEVAVMTNLVALLTLANNCLLVPWLALSSARPMKVCECARQRPIVVSGSRPYANASSRAAK